jgi:hypothetical protein
MNGCVTIGTNWPQIDNWIDLVLTVQRTGWEKPVDYVGLLKVQTPADVGLDSDSAQLSDMIYNPT